jgi:hypothetical protein
MLASCAEALFSAGLVGGLSLPSPWALVGEALGLLPLGLSVDLADLTDGWELRGEIRPFWRCGLVMRILAKDGIATYLFGPPQATAIAQISLTAGPSPPLWRMFGMTISTVLLH